METLFSPVSTVIIPIIHLLTGTKALLRTATRVSGSSGPSNARSLHFEFHNLSVGLYCYYCMWTCEEGLCELKESVTIPRDTSG